MILARAGTPNTATITDFNVFQDYLNFDQAHFANTAALLAATRTSTAMR